MATTNFDKLINIKVDTKSLNELETSLKDIETEFNKLDSIRDKTKEQEKELISIANKKDEIIKQIEDRVPLLINRKYKSVVNAPIPAVHIFGGNDLPPTLERSKAHNRRWTIMKFSTYDSETTTDAERGYVHRAFNHCPEGVITFAVKGLIDLLNNRLTFHAWKESKENVEMWQRSNDPINSFIQEIKDGENPLVSWNDDAWTPRVDVWKRFKEWYKDSYNHDSKIPKTKFFSAIEKSGVNRRISRGVWQLSGFILREKQATFYREKNNENMEQSDIFGTF